MIAELTDRAVIALAGPDARTLLQGLVTNDLRRLRSDNALYAGLLTPQGKILFDFLIAEGEGAVLLDCAATRADALSKRLTMYRLRAKVEIERRPQLCVLAAWDGSALPGVAFPDPRHPALGIRSIIPAAEKPAAAIAGLAYLEHRLSLGIPESEDFGADAMFALDADFDELNGVSFTKGCYVGQELTARMKHRGTARKRLLVVSAETGLPSPGTAIEAGGKAIGDIASSYGTRGFALIRLDRLDEVGSAPLTAEGKPVRLGRQGWLEMASS